MNLFRFILGIFGVILLVGACSFFIPLIFIGGIASGSVAFAFGFPIFLMLLGATMVYFGFYYKGSKRVSNNQLKYIAKWGIIHSVALMLGFYIISRLMITDILIITLLTAIIVLLVAQIVRSHKQHFSMRWFLLYFLIYANIIWVMKVFILPVISSETIIFPSFIIGFTIAGVIIILQKLNMRRQSIPWVSIVLIILLLVGNLESLQISSVSQIIPENSNSLELSEDKQECPSVISNSSLLLNGWEFDPTSVGPVLNNVINTSVWEVEGDIRSCYIGKYKGQYPNWFYCDDMIVSRWETSNYGTINYRWYTAVTSEWKPEVVGNETLGYELYDFSCENGKKVTVDKETTAYYVHVSRDGTEIKIEY
jgi:hypothetical protein